MIKRIEIYKTIQLLIYIAIAIVAVALFVIDGEFASVIGESSEASFMAKAFWGLIILAFIFVFLDFTMYMNANKRLDDLYADFRSDKITRINNRNSVDAYIEGYKGRSIPKNMCCVHFSLHSLEITNIKHDRDEGDKHVKAFSNILGLAALKNAFVGRNGGGDFLVFFENINEDNLEGFFHRIEELVLNHNEVYNDSWIRYRFGVAFNQNLEFTHIGDLINKAYKKCKESEIVPNPEGKFR